jgi:sulfotransferase family protein
MVANGRSAVMPASPKTSPNPYLFIVGSARSGTTLLRRIVAAHRQIAITPETHWVPRWYEKRKGVTPQGTVTSELLDRLANSRRFPRYGIAREDLEQLLEAADPVTYSTFVRGFYDLYGRVSGKRLVGDKTGEYARHIPTLHALWPEARFVHLIRDGRNVCLSVLDWKEKPGASRFATWREDRVSTIAFWWKRNVQLAREAGTRLPAELYYEIRYEALVMQPEEECKSLCDFLDVRFDGSMLRFHEGRTRTEPGLTAKSAWLPITPGLRDWRSEMSKDHLERFEAAAGDVLDELGYERGSTPNSEVVDRATTLRRRFGDDVRRLGQPLPSSW